MQQLICLMGFLAILQMVFLPGYLVLRAFHLKLPIIRVGLLSFSLSFLANYILVFCLTLLHAYTASVVWGIVAIEWIILLCLLWPTQSAWSSWNEQIKQVQSLWQSLNRGSSVDRFIRLGLFFSSILTLLFFIGNAIDQLGQVFSAWDPVMSYNFWATEWAANQFPHYTWHYPQLIPISWSISYVMTSVASLGVNLEFFAKAIMPLFPLMLVLVFFDLAIETRRCAYLLGIIITAYLIYHFSADLGQGWVDMPMSFFAFLGLALLYLAANNDRAKCYMILAALCCAASAVTKQAGLYILLWYPVLCCALSFRSQPYFTRISPILLSWLLALVISLPWYIAIQYQIGHNLASSEVGFVTSNIYQVLGFGWGQRIALGVFQLGLVFWVGLGLTMVYACYPSPWRILALPLVGYTLIWIAFYSYALRNFTLAIPMLSLMAGLGVEKLYQKGCFNRLLTKISNYMGLNSYKPLHIIIGLVMAVAVLTQIPQCSSQVLIQEQISQQKMLGNPDLNWMLFRYQALHGFDGKIMTSWDYLEYVPGLSQYYQPYRPADVEANPYQSSWMVDPKQLSGILQKYPASYILVAKGGGLASQAYLSYLDQLEQNHRLKAVMILPNFTLYQIMQPIH
ncbi:MAG: hypothetical protein K0R66_988 [Gammaproteobacteria bacterium]|nr:hypothetical protein [Gammaproteobacteria bacterium]